MSSAWPPEAIRWESRQRPAISRQLRSGLRKIGVDHACALMIPADSMAEFEDQVEWFAKTVM